MSLGLVPRVGKRGHFPVERERHEAGAAVIIGDEAVEQTASGVGLQGSQNGASVLRGDQPATQHLEEASAGLSDAEAERFMAGMKFANIQGTVASTQWEGLPKCDSPSLMPVA